MSNSVSFAGPNRTFNLVYGKKSGEKGKAAGYKLNVTNNETGAQKTFGGFAATNGQHTVAGRGRINHETGAKAFDVGHKGPNGFQRASGVSGPNGSGYRIASRDQNGELLNVWKNYTQA